MHLKKLAHILGVFPHVTSVLRAFRHNKPRVTAPHFRRNVPHKAHFATAAADSAAADSRTGYHGRIRILGAEYRNGYTGTVAGRDPYGISPYACRKRIICSTKKAQDHSCAFFVLTFLQESGTTFTARSFPVSLGSGSVSKETFCPSFSVRNPSVWIAEK